MNFLQTDEKSGSAMYPPLLSTDARLSDSNTVLMVLSKEEDVEDDIVEDLIDNFFGVVITDINEAPSLTNKTVFLCGDINSAPNSLLETAASVSIISELSSNFTDTNWPVVNVGRVPINIYDVGVYYRNFFQKEDDLFSEINGQHVFQGLTESNKPGTAHRTGIYLTPVEEQNDDLHFHLLRCSSNLSGPTGNFQSKDKIIVDALNSEADNIFDNQALLNHVLAQIYRNTPSDGQGKKATKAKIKDHSDKTKDMPKNGLMAFVTFYDQVDLKELQCLDKYGFDFGVRGQSALTKLNFRLKRCVWERDSNCTLPRQFSLTLYPNSVFFMPLSTNRLYTHEIQPSHLDVRHLPTRMGYVVRCSDTKAVHRNGNTYIKVKGEENSLIKLEPPTLEGMASLRHLYAMENQHDDVINYGDIFFSMNGGDYVKPLQYNLRDDFSHHEVLSLPQSYFSDLLSSVQFEVVGKGRFGAVLVDSDNSPSGVPIVRTTTKYDIPAQTFQCIHIELAERIKALTSLSCHFNNALIEKYTNDYTTMGFHSDQALDLRQGSAIAVFSCYKYPEKDTPSRKLIIESKEHNGGIFEIPLRHHSVVVFSVDTNKRFKHKIVMDQSARPDSDQEWLGITFRTSKTFIKIMEEGAYFEDNTPMSLADAGQKKEFYTLRGMENAQIDFRYPMLTYTISASDLMPPNSIASYRR